ncbi:hypothetical protein DICVIV_00445 [Dictyocaulus viviparus]|uniref:Glycosyltransferase family 92 protein n=1 Tax=Dictyocaulus viviparus TaxID=29172 RepID=A0A0D8YAV4_DICVI|nr:hypothetical protein DICVIV_00445 [Dictyocaulus viviparus]
MSKEYEVFVCGSDWRSMSPYTVITAPRYRRLCCITCINGALLLLFIAAVALSYFDKQHNNIIREYVARQDDIVILSATYYNRSRSFENNTVVLLLNAHQVLHLKHPELHGLSSNSSTTEAVTFRIYPVVRQIPFYCKWIPFIAIGQVNEGMTSLQLTTGETAMTISTRRPYTEQHDVIACFSPLFLNERWQLLLLTAEVYSHYGAVMHFYVRSMITDLFTILNRYPNVRINPWPSIRLGVKRANLNTFDPNLELEFRNQAAAMTDCLLLYKIFLIYPTAAAVAYNMSQSEITSFFEFMHYEVAGTFEEETSFNEVSDCRSIITLEVFTIYSLDRSKFFHVDSKEKRLTIFIAKLHPIPIYSYVSLPIELNSALHLRFWNFINDTVPNTTVGPWPTYDPLLKHPNGIPLIAQQDLYDIHQSFLTNMQNMMNVYRRLPEFPTYYPLIEQCYNRIFYNGEQHSKCKGPELCEIPRIDNIRCVNINNDYETIDGYSRTIFHRLIDVHFVFSENGCVL